MAEYDSKKIKNILEQIENETIILPAMQRSFVWPEEKIYNLFDSLMRNYPIGTFLFWDINGDTFNKYVFNSFIKEYDESKGKFQRGNESKTVHENYLAVLDGQQRLTSLYIGTCGKEHLHQKGKKKDDPNSFYDAYLCIDILFIPNSEEKYSFCFCRNDDIEKIITDDEGKQHFWVKVNTVFTDFGNFGDESEYTDYLAQQKIFKNDDCRISARRILKQLHKALTETPNISFYPASKMDLSEVVDIFVRVNSGGEKLSSSDLMLSVAAGELREKDIHKILQDAINEINDSQTNPDTGFVMDKETILTAGLMFTNAKSLYLSNSANYTSERMKLIFEDNWVNIIEALKNTVSYIEYVGFIGRKLSNSIILPIAYYFYKNKLTESHKNSKTNRGYCDRIFIRQWLLRSMLKDVFMEGTAATLLRFRDSIFKSKKKHFPLEELMDEGIKKSLTITEDQINDILELKIGDSKIVPLLDELMRRDPVINTDVDHIWPKTILTSKQKILKIFDATEEQIKCFKYGCNSIQNLQLLDSGVNRSKSDTPYNEWLISEYKDKTDLDRYFAEHLIPKKVSYELSNLKNFWEERRKLLTKKIKEAFPDKFDVIVSRYNLEDKLK